jgi:hypothetical protein
MHVNINVLHLVADASGALTAAAAATKIAARSSSGLSNVAAFPGRHVASDTPMTMTFFRPSSTKVPQAKICFDRSLIADGLMGRNGQATELMPAHHMLPPHVYTPCVSKARLQSSSWNGEIWEVSSTPARGAAGNGKGRAVAMSAKVGWAVMAFHLVCCVSFTGHMFQTHI